MMSPRQSTRPADRRGSTYLLVLFTSLIVSAIGISAFAVVRMQDHRATLERDWNDSASLAVSATEFGLANLSDYYYWRNNYGAVQNGNYTAARTFGRGTIRWQLTDPIDADIADSQADPIRIYGRGKVGDSERIFSVLAWPSGSTLDVLRTAIHASVQLTVDEALDVRDGPASSNYDFLCDHASVLGDVESPRIDKPENVIGLSQTTLPVKTMPVALIHSVYKSFASEIPYSSLVLLGGTTLQEHIISPRHHPTDPERTNANGLYWIKIPSLSSLTITDCRIEGTLLIELSPTSSFNVGPNVVWKPYRPDFPAMIVYTASDLSTPVSIECSGQLSETATGVNFNPTEASYYGISDSDITDTYNASIRGLVHIIRNAGSSPSSLTTINASRKITGCIIADGRVEVIGDSILVADPLLYAKPPLGYTTYPNPGNLLVNGNMESGLTGWTPVGSKTKIFSDNDRHSGAFSVRVQNRSSAADGVRQDITSRIQSGVKHTSDVWVKMQSTTEDVKITLEVSSTGSGLQRLEATAPTSTEWTRIRAVQTPTWSGTLNYARWIVCTTTTDQHFKIDDASIADPSDGLPVNLTPVPGTWRAEPIP